MRLSKESFRQWLASAEFRKSVAVQVTSGLIITAIVAIIGLGVHEVRSDRATERVPVARTAPRLPAAAKPPQPASLDEKSVTGADQQKPSPTQHADEQQADELAAAMIGNVAWVLSGVFILTIALAAMRMAVGIR